MLELAEKLAALESEQQQIANNYKEAEQVKKNCEIRLLKLNGAIEAMKDLMKETTEAETTEAETT